jgi:NADH:ubiquinone oxidoreductase subunit E
MAWIVENRLQPPTKDRTDPWITEAIRNKIVGTYFPRYPNKRAALLPLFHEIMHTHGFIAAGSIDEAAALLEIPASEVQDAVTFYEEFRLAPTGKYVVNVCRSISCELCGSNDIKKKIKQTFDIDPGETTDDGLFTYFEVECLGLCEYAPAALINEDLVGPIVKPDEFVAKLKSLPKDVHHGNGHH